MITKKDNFLIELNEIDREIVDKINFKEIYQRAKDFFELKKEIQIRIKLLYSIEEFNFYSYSNFERWNVGFVGSPHIVFIFSPSVIEELTIHKKSEFIGLLNHEIGHIFYGNSHFAKVPLFEEGLMQYFGQYDTKNKTKINSEFNLADFIMGNKNIELFYGLGFISVKTIIDRYGKDKLFYFLSELNKNPSKDFQSFQNIFLESFGISFTQFNEDLNEVTKGI